MMSKRIKKAVTCFIAAAVIMGGISFQYYYHQVIQPASVDVHSQEIPQGQGGGFLAKWDKRGFWQIHTLSGSRLDYVFAWTTYLGVLYVLGPLILILMLVWDPGRAVPRFFFYLAAAVATELVYYGLKYMVARPRPFETMEQVRVIFEHPQTASFPSGHATMAFMSAFLLHRLYGRKLTFVYLIAGLIAFSRIYIGVHYPSDVIAGAVLGLVLGYAMISIASHRRWEAVIIRH